MTAGLANLADGIAALAFLWLASLKTRDPMLIAFVGIAISAASMVPMRADI